MEEEDHGIAAPISPLERYVRLGLLEVFVSSVKAVQRFRTENFYVGGLEHLATTDEAGKKTFRMPEPYIFLGQHVSWDDFVNLPPIWDMFPEKILFTGPARNDYLRELLPKHPSLSAIGDGMINALLGLLFFPIYRTWTVQNPNEEERRKMQEHNRSTQEHVVRAYQKGINLAIMPEGTSKTDGRIAKIRTGAYTYTTMTDVKPYCIPFGNTYDYYAGKKPHVFVRFGIPYKYDHVFMREGESPEEYRRQDVLAFNNRIREAFIDLNTITATQLIAAALYSHVDRNSVADKLGLVFTVNKLVDSLRVAELFVDPALASESAIKQRVDVVIGTLLNQGYVTLEQGNIKVKKERAIHEPVRVEDYKKENMLLYQYHKLREVAEARSQVALILERSLGHIPKY